MTNLLPIEHHGQVLWLLSDKAIYWPARHALLVADVHIGKAASYRALHQPVPRGTTEATLSRLDALLARHDCEQLIILGDFLHARAAQAPATLATLQAWRERHRTLKIVLIRGNHDRNAGDPPASLGIEVVSEPWLLEPFALQHEPRPTRPNRCWRARTPGIRPARQGSATPAIALLPDRWTGQPAAGVR